MNNTPSIAWQFDTRYTQLPELLYTPIAPTAVADPQLVVVNEKLGDALGLQLSHMPAQEQAQMFSGNVLPEGATPIAQAYAGHQFGHFTLLGDGRAHLLGEHITPQQERVDIALKGSGRTPYARRGDGRATLGPMLREYIISEAMYALGIPTTRSLAVVTTGEPVMRETLLTGAVLTRVAASHIRVGTFEYIAHTGDKQALRQLADYTIKRHFAALAGSKQPYLDLLLAVMDRQIALVSEWLRVGFIHGVMNTDNMAISGETIDYGPCAFMDGYDPQTVFSSIDQMGRYAYAAQPQMVGWNVARLAEALLPLLHADQATAIEIAEQALHEFSGKFQQQWLAMMRRKLGLFGQEAEDETLIKELLQWMQHVGADYTNSFREISADTLAENALYQDQRFVRWHAAWQQRLSRNGKPLADARAVMHKANPAFIPRNHRVEAALRAAEEDADFSVLQSLLQVLATPYVDTPEYAAFKTPPAPAERIYQTFCGT